MREMLEQKLKRFSELENQLIDPAILADSTKISAVAREHGSLKPLATTYRKFKDLSQQISEAKEMVTGDDVEMRELAQLELVQLKEDREKSWSELLDMTAGGEDAHRSRCVMEIRAGTGGDEAALFARNLYEMYKKHAEHKGWKTELLAASPTELGGFKEISLAFEGEGVYRELQYESGGHRVQRVPETETKGRIHTSAATVAVLPEPEDVEVNLKPDDYRKDIYHASGPGGQHVNKTASAVRLTHHETGIAVAIQDEKSQHKNLAKALRVLKSRIYDMKQQEEQKKRADERKTMVGSGDRSQRIRTYNFPENRVTHHSINLTLYKLDQLMSGNLEPITSALVDFDRDDLRRSMGNLDEN
ncbi:MAG: peptide chain release factor 1 [Planctomycetaceae bacterium]|nr:peptide chain release factor 1 [Planctomycetaceae bacterium]MBP63456.1 peptide chain release factor 1 [Planctomycetaceae bacterium]